MKKAKLFLSLAILIILSAIPTMAYADTVDTISEEFGYEYRWTVEAELDDTYSDTWLNSISENDKIKISFVDTNRFVFYKTETGVLVFEGKESVVLPCRYVDGDFGKHLAINNAPSYQRVVLNMYRDKKTSGEETFFALYLVNLGDGKHTTPIVVDESTIFEAEDTNLILCDRFRYNRKYVQNKNGMHTAAEFNRSGKELIYAKAVMNENKKTPSISDKEIIEAYRSYEDRTHEFDITKEQIKIAKENDWVKNSTRDGVVYRVDVLDGKDGTEYWKTIQNGKMKFSVTVTSEWVKGISSDGEITVAAQAYDRHYNIISNPSNVFTKYSTVILVTLSGDLGEKSYVVEKSRSARNLKKQDDVNYIPFPLLPVVEVNDSIIVSEYAKEAANELGDIYLDEYDTLQLYCEYVNDAYCGLNKVGICFGEDIYSVELNQTQIDFNVEVELSSYLVEEASFSLVEKIRRDREYNNELEQMPINDLQQFDKYINNDNAIRISLHDEPLEFADQEPVIVNDRVLVPLRVIFEELGADVSWNGEKQEVTMKKDGVTVSLIIGAAELIKNGEKAELDAAAEIRNERTLVPIRAITESFGNTVTWDGNNKIVEIK